MHAIELICLNAIKPNPRNAHTHSKKQIRQIANSIDAFGFTAPVIVDETLTLLAGHGRFEAAKLRGLEKMPAELIGVFRVGETPYLNNIKLGRHGRSRSNVWHYPGVNSFRAGRMDELRAHPTVKPVALVADAMKDCTRRHDIVLDTFCGSGTTILAAERVGRRAYRIELEARYVDVAIRRWQAFTRRDAVHMETGSTFDDRALVLTPDRTES